MKRLSFIISVIILISVAYSLSAQQLNIESIPYELSFENNPKGYEVLSQNSISITASAKTDLFVSPDGKYNINNSPRLVFSPDSAFIFTVKIQPELKENWDAGAILIYNDSLHFAKFCFEKDYQGNKRIVSVVVNKTGDDCNSILVEKGYGYFRIIGSTHDNTFSFFYSENGQDWLLIRVFKLNISSNIRIGMSSQSAIGTGCKVTFSEINLQERKPENWWNGK